MQPIPIPITDVDVYPYIAGVTIPVTAVVSGASGTYSIGTLTTNVFYNMSLSGGTGGSKLKVGATYYAIAKDSSGHPVDIHWMYCLTAGSAPTFGLTKSLTAPHLTAPALGMEDGPYIQIEALKDFKLTYTLPPPAIGTIVTPIGDHGCLISTRVGTPHLMGFQIDDPKAPSSMAPGASGLTVTATVVSSGQEITYTNMTVESVGPPMILLKTFP